MLAIWPLVLDFFANVSDQGRILLLDGLANQRQLLLHLLQLDSSDAMAVLDLCFDLGHFSETEVAPEQLQLLEGEDVIEEHVSAVVRIELHLTLVGLWARDRLVKQLDEHGEVVLELRVQGLLLSHHFVLEDVCGMLVQKVVVLCAQ